MMSAAGLGAAHFLVDPSELVSAIQAGLAAAGVALVVNACLGLGKKLCLNLDTQVGSRTSQTDAFTCASAPSGPHFGETDRMIHGPCVLAPGAAVP